MAYRTTSSKDSSRSAEPPPLSPCSSRAPSADFWDAATETSSVYSALSGQVVRSLVLEADTRKDTASQSRIKLADSPAENAPSRDAHGLQLLEEQLGGVREVHLRDCSPSEAGQSGSSEQG